MIRRVKRTCSLILLTAAVAGIIPSELMNTPVNAAVNSNSNIEIAKNDARLAGESTPTDEQILQMFTEYLNKTFSEKYPGCTVTVGAPTYITLKLTSLMEKTIASKICSNDDTVRQLLKSQPDSVRAVLKGKPDTVRQILIMQGTEQQVAEAEKNKGEKLTDEEKNMIMKQVAAKVNSTVTDDNISAVVDDKFSSKEATDAVVDAMTTDDIKAIRPTVEKSVVEMIDKKYNGKDFPVYKYKVTQDITIKEEGFFVGGELGALYYQVNKKPLMVEGPELNTAIKNKIIQAIVGSLAGIIDKTGIGSFIDKVTDAADDLSNALDDLADSLKDKSDDIDDAWDKVFDRFDNDEGWGKRDGYIYYYDEDGVSLKGVQKINGKTYYFNRIDGAMETGWQIVDGKRCYFDKDKGYQVFLQWVQDGEDWYFLNADGTTRKSEWINDGGKWYYVKADGKMAKEWIKVDDYWYYLNPGNGEMATSTWILYDDNKWRYVKSNGAAANDWTCINGSWYYFKENTAELQTGWFRADGSWYYSDSNGVMQTGWASSKDGWSYLDNNTGKMKKNEWAYSNGSWYYFNVNGIMVTGKRYIDGTKYTFNSDGRLA